MISHLSYIGIFLLVSCAGTDRFMAVGNQRTAAVGSGIQGDDDALPNDGVMGGDSGDVIDPGSGDGGSGQLPPDDGSGDGGDQYPDNGDISNPGDDDPGRHG